MPLFTGMYSIDGGGCQPVTPPPLTRLTQRPLIPFIDRLMGSSLTRATRSANTLRGRDR